MDNVHYIMSRDTLTHRVCSTCGELKEVKDFYKDGTTPAGAVKYRRDCKDCYKQTRIREAKVRKKK